jgi:hypothetical protein
MTDLLRIALAAAFFTLCMLCARACERLRP